MTWQDRLAGWVSRQVERSPALDHWLEKHIHAIGLHGPQVRHLLRTRFVPAVALLSAVVLVLLVAAVTRRVRRSRDPGRRQAAPAARPPRPPSLAQGPPPGSQP